MPLLDLVTVGRASARGKSDSPAGLTLSRTDSELVQVQPGIGPGLRVETALPGWHGGPITWAGAVLVRSGRGTRTARQFKFMIPSPRLDAHLNQAAGDSDCKRLCRAAGGPDLGLGNY